MKKYLSIYLYGAIIIFAGVFLLFSEYTSFDTLKLTIGISLTIAAIFSSISALSSRKSHVEFAYHEMHALAMLVYGVSVLLFCKTLETLTSLTAFLFIFYSFSEFIFCLRLFDLGKKVVLKIIIVRLVLGLAIGVGTIVAMNVSEFTLEGFGILFIMVGLNIMLYAPIMKNNKLNNIS
ncbi:MAG: uncharacterized membrane protein HdeD (DUF308 family) [Roseivirga sp.]|jgi:uncharacterized membrane protein HdeD (DUF308 family)